VRVSSDTTACAVPDVMSRGVARQLDLCFRSQGMTLAELRKAAKRFEDVAEARWNDPEVGFSHHVFGRVSLSDGWRFTVVHTDHHTGQLPGG